MTSILELGEGWFPDEPGGLNRYFCSLVEALRGAGLDVRGVVIGRPGAPEGVTVAGARDTPLMRRLRSHAATAVKLGRSADLVDAHFALYAVIPTVLGPLRRKPLVVHFQGPWADESASAGERSRLVLAAKRRLERAVYTRASALVTLSTAFRRLLIERYGVTPWRVEVIPPGVDLDRFSPGPRAAARAGFELGKDRFVVCSVRRLVPRMGIDVLIEAWAKIDRDHMLLVAGTGPERGRLEDLAESLGISEQVRFLGEVSDDELVSIYRASDVCAVPSVALEGFGLVVLESLACGTPAVVSNVDGLRAALAGLEPAAVVPPGDAQALAERLVQPFADGPTCRKTAEHFSWSVCAERHRDLYTRTLNGASERNLRVVYVDHTARLSGAELALSRLLAVLPGVDAHVILGEDGPLVDRLQENGISVEVLPLPTDAAQLGRENVRATTLGSKQGLQTAAYTARLARRLRRYRPDLVHTNSLKAAFYGAAAARLAGIPVVAHAHDRLADDYLPRSSARLARLAYARLPHTVIAPSRAVASTLGRDAHVIPWAVPLPEVRRSRNGEPFTVGMIGRIARWKGQETFIEAFSLASIDSDAEALIVGAPLFGSEEEEYAAELREFVTSKGLDGRVHFTGFVDDTASVLGRLDVLVHASSIPEPFGQVVVEGMAAGVPVVAPAAGGPLELISDGIDGLLYPQGDTAALAACLTRLNEDPALRQRLGAAGRLRVEQYSPANAAARVRAVYEDVLANRPRPKMQPVEGSVAGDRS